MANAQQGEVPLTVGSQHFTLKLSTAAMAEFETACNRPGQEWIAFPELIARAMQGSPYYVPRFLWACFLKHHPKTKLEQVFDLIDEAGGIGVLTDTIAALFNTTKPDPEDDRSPQTTQPNPPGAGADSTSKPAPSA